MKIEERKLKISDHEFTVKGYCSTKYPILGNLLITQS